MRALHGGGVNAGLGWCREECGASESLVVQGGVWSIREPGAEGRGEDTWEWRLL